MKINAILLKPLDGEDVGAPRAFDLPDFERLERFGAVRRATGEDAEPAPVDEQAVLLDRLRHPVDGPKLLDEMKVRFEEVGADRLRLASEVTAEAQRAKVAEEARDDAIADRDRAIAARDQAVIDRDTAVAAREAAEEAAAALQKDLDAARSAQPSARAKARGEG